MCWSLWKGGEDQFLRLGSRSRKFHGLVTGPHERGRINCLPAILPCRTKVVYPFVAFSVEQYDQNAEHFLLMFDHPCADVLFWYVAMASDLNVQCRSTDSMP